MPFQNISYAQTALKFRLIFAFDLSRFLRSQFVTSGKGPVSVYRADPVQPILHLV